MSNEIKCPICGKVGISDFHKEDVKCPCCGSDLSIYRVIDEIPEGSSGKNIWKPIAAVAFIAAAVLAAFLLFNKKPEVVSGSNCEEQIAMLQDSIKTLQEQITASSKSDVVKKEEGFAYVIRKGDCYWTLAKKFLGSGTRASEIAEMNNLTTKDNLHVGDTIYIKN